MDPTAPNNNSSPPDSNVPPETPNSIQPGQFVVAGEDSEAKNFPPPPEPQQNEALNFSNPPNQEQPAPEAVIPATLKVEDPPQEPLPQSPQTSPFPETPLDFSPTVSGPRPQQPDPTPFTESQGLPPTADKIPESGASGPLKKIALFLGILILIGIISVVAWIVINNKNLTGLTQVKTAVQTQTTEPSPLVKRTTGGFSDLPPATNEASPSAVTSPSPSAYQPIP